MSKNNLRAELIKARGGKCEVCGYDRSTRAIRFVNLIGDCPSPSKAIETAGNLDRAIKRAKCFAMMCANCEAEFQDGNIDINHNGSLVNPKFTFHAYGKLAEVEIMLPQKKKKIESPDFLGEIIDVKATVIK